MKIKQFLKDLLRTMAHETPAFRSDPYETGRMNERIVWINILQELINEDKLSEEQYSEILKRLGTRLKDS